MEYTILALVFVLLLGAFITWLVMSSAQRGGGPPNGRNGSPDHDDTAEHPPPEDEPRIEIESEKLANRPR